MSLQEEHKQIMDGMVDFFRYGVRSPVYRRPSKYGLKYEDVFFTSTDGVPLEGWFIPGNSNKVVICNHFMPGNRYGYPGHLPGYGDFGGFEVNFIPYYKALHDAGFNVLTYDIRNHGLSGQGSGGSITIGLKESRDVIASVKYIESRPDTKDMEKAMISICLGFDSTIIAMDEHPEVFRDIKVLIGLQPISLYYFIEKAAINTKMPVKEAIDYFNEKLRAANGYTLDDFSLVPYAKGVTVPTKVFQIKNDYRTNVVDVENIYNGLSSKEKELQWIEGTERFEGYNYFSRTPEPMLEWLAKYI